MGGCYSKWFRGENFKNTAAGTLLPSGLHRATFTRIVHWFSSLAECGAPATPSLTMRDFQSGVISLPETQLPITAANYKRTTVQYLFFTLTTKLCDGEFAWNLNGLGGRVY